MYLDNKDVFYDLTDEQAGLLIKAIFKYQETGEIIVKGLLKTVFLTFKSTLDRNEEKWEDIKQKRSEAGKKGMKNRWNSKEENITNDNKCYQEITNITVNDSVNDNVNVNDSVSVINNISSNSPTLTDIISYGSNLGASNEYCERFYNHYESTDWINANGIKIKNWKLTFNNWYKKDVESGKTKNNKEYDTETVFTEKDTNRFYQYDKEGNKHFV